MIISSHLAWHVQRDVDYQIRLTLERRTSSASAPRNRDRLDQNKKKRKETDRIPQHAPFHPHGQILISSDIDIQAVGLITSTALIRRDACLAVILRVSRRTGIYNLDDDGSIDLVGGDGAVWADVVDAVAGAALDGCWRARWWDVSPRRVLSTICCAEGKFFS